jgi:hypothetical protein
MNTVGEPARARELFITWLRSGPSCSDEASTDHLTAADHSAHRFVVPA